MTLLYQKLETVYGSKPRRNATPYQVERVLHNDEWPDAVDIFSPTDLITREKEIGEILSQKGLKHEGR